MISLHARFARDGRSPATRQSGGNTPYSDTDADLPRTQLDGEFIASVDASQLNQLKWPIMRALTPGYVAHVELDHYLDQLLKTGLWREVHAVPHVEAARRSKHVFDVYGQRA